MFISSLHRRCIVVSLLDSSSATFWRMTVLRCARWPSRLRATPIVAGVWVVPAPREAAGYIVTQPCPVLQKSENKDKYRREGKGRVVLWCGVNQMVIHFFKVSVPPSSHYSIHPFLQIILVENSSCGKKLNQFRSPINSNNVWLPFSIILILLYVTETLR